MNKILLLSAFLLVMSGCLDTYTKPYTNPYTQFYIDYSGGINVLDDPRFIVGIGEPRLFLGFSVEQDERRLLEDGYILLGVSGFNGADKEKDEDQWDAFEHAKKVHANRVIIYSKYTDTRSGIASLTVPDIRTTYHSGTISGLGGFGHYSGSSTTYGSKTIYKPYSVDMYDYFATFWIKMKMRLGIHSRDLTPEERKSLGTNKGMCVTVIVKNSTAFEADLVPGDIIRKLNEVEIIDRNHFFNVLDRCEAQTIRLEISRQGKKIVKEVTLSASDYRAGRVSSNKSSEPYEQQSDIGAPEPEFEPEFESQVNISGRQISGYKLKRDESGEPAKDKDDRFIFIPVYEVEQK